MTADELFKKYWPPNVNRSLWTDEHRYVAEVMFKVAWDHLWAELERTNVHQEDTDRLLYKEIEQVYELNKELQRKDEILKTAHAWAERDSLDPIEQRFQTLKDDVARALKGEQ